MGYINILSFVISVIASHIGAPMVWNMLYKSNTLDLNYRNEEIPSCMGLLFLFVQCISVSVILLLTQDNVVHIISYLFAFTLIGLTGLLDDLIGDKNVKGFKGHIKSFFKGNLTTGGTKAGIGFFVALFVSI